MKFRTAAALAAMMALAACGTPPKTYNFDRSNTYPVSKDEAWERLLTYFTSNNIQIKTIEKDSGVIYAERALVDASIADCGQGGLAADVSRTGGLNVFVRSIWPAAGFVDTEIRCLTELESWNAEKEVQPRVQA